MPHLERKMAILFNEAPYFYEIMIASRVDPAKGSEALRIVREATTGEVDGDEFVEATQTGSPEPLLLHCEGLVCSLCRLQFVSGALQSGSTAANANVPGKSL
jgi:hypothetical protein